MRRDLGLLTAREHDLLVVGGGITGAVAAWDAAQRGLSVALVEAEDFGAGASWNSLKTIHGGLRHLQRADVSGLRESVRERRALLRIAPALVRPLPFLLPTYGHGPKGREALAVALWLNDCLGWDRNQGLDPAQRIPPGRSLSRRQVLELVPGIPQAGLSGGAVWTDAQVSSSERLVVAFVQAAASAGAVVANHLPVTGVLRKDATVVGVRVRDGVTGHELEVRAGMVLNAAGAASDRILQLAGLTPRPVPLLRAVNLVLARPVVTSHAVGASSGGRFLFLVPWAGRAIVGTAYEPAERPEAEGETARFLEDAARAYPWADLRPADVTLVHRGDVPGSGDASGLWTRSRVIDHAREHGLAGMLTLLAVKYTTARGTAEQAVDRVAAILAKRLAPCRTAETPLPAARPLEGALAQQALHAVREEMALTLADAVLRRLDLGTAGRPAEVDVETVCQVQARELGWGPGRVASEREALARPFA